MQIPGLLAPPTESQSLVWGLGSCIFHKFLGHFCARCSGDHSLGSIPRAFRYGRFRADSSQHFCLRSKRQKKQNHCIQPVGAVSSCQTKGYQAGTLTWTSCSSPLSFPLLISGNMISLLCFRFHVRPSYPSLAPLSSLQIARI